MREKLEQIAALVATLPGKYRNVALGCEEDATRALLAVEGAKRMVSVYRRTDGSADAIESAYVQIGTVEIRSQFARGATAEEIASLETDPHEARLTYTRATTIQ